MKLELLKPQLGIIAGARILSRHVIECFRTGIINLHPGLLPNTRGLDALQWALFRDQPLGVTAHLINERVDAGHILDQCIIDEYPDDTFVDLSLRLYETQLVMVPSAIRKAVSVSKSELRAVGTSLHNAPFPAELVPQLRWRFRERRRRLRLGRPGAMSAIA
jgi:phosphoribosylglycinamide formyltransferase-1